MLAHEILRQVATASIQSDRSQSWRIRIDILIELTVPALEITIRVEIRYLIVDVKEWVVVH